MAQGLRQGTRGNRRHSPVAGPTALALACLLPLPGKAPREPGPGPAQKVVRALYPRGPGLAAQGLMLQLTWGDPAGRALVFLHRRGWIRLQPTPPPGKWQRRIIGPSGSFSCTATTSSSLTGQARQELTLLRDGLALIALWPLLDRKARVTHDTPLRLVDSRGDRIEVQVDGAGLPSRISSTGAGGTVEVAATSPGGQRLAAPLRWPARVVIKGGSLSLTVTTHSAQGFQAAREDFFSPPEDRKSSSAPTLPPGVRIGRIDFQRLPAAEVIVLPATADPGRWEQTLIAAGRALAPSGTLPAGLPAYIHEKNGWLIHLPCKGGGKPPRGLTRSRSRGGLHAITFVLGNWDEMVLEKAAWLERSSWAKGYRATGQPVIIPYRRPGQKCPEKGARLTEIRLPVISRH